MESRLYLLIFVSLFVQNFADSTAKPPIIEVNEENQEEFQLPVGTRLELDGRTQRYKPPPLSNNFTAEDRYQIMWKNPLSHNNYCKVGPTLHRSLVNRMQDSYFYYSWCLDKKEDLCCDLKRCTCGGRGGFDCSCLSTEASRFYELKKKNDQKLVKGIFTFGVKVIMKILEAKKGKKSLDEDTEASELEVTPAEE